MQLEARTFTGRDLRVTLIGCVSVLAMLGTLVGSSQDYVWFQGSGGPVDDYAYAVAIDTSDNVYTTGQFSGTAVFGWTNLSSRGQADIFVAKYSPAGELLWVVQAGGTGGDSGQGIAVSSSGDVYVTGSFNGTAIFSQTNLTVMGATSSGVPPNLFV